MGVLRSNELQAKYDEYKKTAEFTGGCALCQLDSLENFKYWKVAEPAFKFDQIAEAHRMLFPVRHTLQKNLTPEEWQEFWEIKESYVNKNYDNIIEATAKKLSIPQHFHLHLIVGRDD